MLLLILLFPSLVQAKIDRGDRIRISKTNFNSLNSAQKDSFLKDLLDELIND